MRMRRIIAATAVTALATGAGLLFSPPTSAATVVPISFDATGLSSTSCPVNLPLNNQIALPPGTPVQFKRGVVSALVATENLTVTPIDAQGKPTGSAVTHTLSWTNAVTYKAGNYRLDWSTVVLGGVLGPDTIKALGTGILEIAAGAAQYQLAVQVPSVGVEPSLLPVVGGVVGSILPP